MVPTDRKIQGGINMMYGMTPFGRNAFDLFNIWNDLDKNYDSMPVNACKTDIIDAGDKYVMESELPGFEKEDIKLDINGEFLVISAEHTAESEEKDDDYLEQYGLKYSEIEGEMKRFFSRYISPEVVDLVTHSKD